MAQKPMLRAEVYAHAMRASKNRKKEVRRKSSYVLTSESEPAGFSAQNSSAEVKDSCSRAEHVQVFWSWSRTVKVCF
jgi:hypothetical protein